MLSEIAIMNKDTRPIEVRVLCQDHPKSGVLAVYEDGLIVIGCMICGKRVGQVELAEKGRPWGKDMRN